MSTDFSRDSIKLDAEKEIDRICTAIRKAVGKTLKRRGAIVAMSGGIDSSVVGALCVKALGPNKVFGLLLPERDSSDETRRLSRGLAESLGVKYTEEEITPILEGARCYERRDEAIKKCIPEYGPGWKSKIVLPTVTDNDMFRIFSVVAQKPDGEMVKARMDLDAYLGVVAATNFKQRTRKMLEYYHADRLNYAVAGTPNLLEYDQGFFVKNGDGSADFKPIAHLYKTQVFQLAEALGVPEDIRKRPPTTDTYSLPQSQEEFYYSLPYHEMDLCLYAKNHGVSPADAGKALGMTAEQIERVYRDIESKRAFAKYLHMHALTVDEMLD